MASGRYGKSATMKYAILLIPRNTPYWEIKEAHALAETAGYSIVDTLRYRRLSRSKILSDAKLEELVQLVNKYIEYSPTIILFDDMKPREYFKIVKKTRREVIDRTLLLLEIFALHAGSKEAKLQIELAKLHHQLPLVREAIRLAKLRELPGFLGPGTYAIDAYYKHIVSRISRIKNQLENLRRRRAIERSKRSSKGIPHVSIVGYASAGKTSLFNKLTGFSKPVGEEYFTTISPKVGSTVSDGLKIAFIDTVGFITRVPPEIIEAFHSTLEEVAYSDIIIYVVDLSEPEDVMLEKLGEGISTLRRIGVVGKPLIVAANKIDLVGEETEINRLSRIVESVVSSTYPAFKSLVPISATKGDGIGELLWTTTKLLKSMVKYTF